MNELHIPMSSPNRREVPELFRRLMLGLSLIALLVFGAPQNVRAQTCELPTGVASWGNTYFGDGYPSATEAAQAPVIYYGNGNYNSFVGEFDGRANGQSFGWAYVYYLHHSDGAIWGHYWVYPTMTDGTRGFPTPAGTGPLNCSNPPPPPFDFNPDKNNGNSCPANAPPLACGNPINTSTGNKVQTETDYAGNGLLQFVRYYNGASTAASDFLGNHWTSTYSRRIKFDASAPTIAAILRPDGRGITFNLVAGVWQSAEQVEAKLQRVDGPTGELVGWTYMAKDSRQVEDYDAQGRLIGITHADGQSVVLIYNNGLTENNVNDYLPSSVTAQDGRSLTFIYTSGRLTQLTDPSGAVYGYTYDAAGNLQSVTYPGGTGKTYLYNEAAYTTGANLPTALTGIVDEKGQRFATFKFAADGRAISTEHAGGVDLNSMVYNADGSASVTKPDGATEQRTFVAPNGVKRVAGTSVIADGVTRESTYTYDNNGFVDITSEPFGATTPIQVTTDHDFDARGLLIQVIESANQSATRRTIQTDWHATFSVPTERRVLNSSDVLEAKNTWTYNTRGQALTATQVHLTNAALSRTTTTSYCEAADVSAGTCPRVGLVTSINGPRTDVADVTSYTYYQTDDATCASAPTTCPHRKGDLWKVSNALGQVSEILRYDGAGRVLSVKDANGVVTDMEYSSRGWLTASKVRGADNGTEADDAITRLDYEPTGTVSKATQPDGAFVAFTYDAAHRLTDVTDALGNTTHYTLNNAGATLQEDTKNNAAVLKRTLSRVYNSLGQLQTAIDANGVPTGMTYNINGELNKVTDALGRITDNNVDALGRRILTTVNTAGGATDKAISQFQYDARDHLTTVIDPKGLSTTYGYDSLGDLTQLVSPDTGTTTYSYDLAGNRASQLDARTVTTSYSYDALNRLTLQALAQAGQNVSFFFDTPTADCAVGETFGAGRLARIIDQSGSTRYCYDRFGHIVRKVQTVANGPTLTVGTTYTGADRLVAMTYPSGAVVTYSRNGNGQIQAIAAQPTAGAPLVTLVSDVGYLPFGPTNTLTFGNGRVLTKTYDKNYGIDQVSDSAAGGLSQDASLDNAGNLTTLVERTAPATNVTRTITYDGLDRLTALKSGATVVQGFAYDATGNRLSKTINGTTTTNTIAASSHRLTQVGAIARTYDANGNTTKIGTPTLGYNLNNRMDFYQPSGLLTKVNYRYNGRGERVSKTKGFGTSENRYYVYDESGHLLGEYLTNGTRVQEYVWMDDTLVAVLSSHDGSTYQYVETDHLGTPRAVVHPTTNAIIWRWNLTDTAFGEHLPAENPDANSFNYVLNFRYPGQWYDAESKLHYNYFRDYDPATGRYIESDPIGLAGGMSTYGYVSGNPIGLSDPEGLHAQPAPRPVPVPPASSPGFNYGPPANNPVYGPGWVFGPTCAAVAVGVVSIVMPGNFLEGSNCSDDPKRERSECGGGDGSDPCKGLRDILREHEQKLRDYQADPQSQDHKGLLGQGRDAVVIAGRIRNLMNQIANFKRQLAECERKHGR